MKSIVLDNTQQNPKGKNAQYSASASPLLCSSSQRKRTMSIWRMNEQKPRCDGPGVQEGEIRTFGENKLVRWHSVSLEIVPGYRETLEARQLILTELCLGIRYVLGILNRLFSLILKITLKDCEEMCHHHRQSYMFKEN